MELVVVFLFFSVGARETTTKYLSETIGSNVLLECDLPNAVVWRRNKTLDVIAYNGKESDTINRVVIKNKSQNQIDLSINNLTETDADEYCCSANDNKVHEECQVTKIPNCTIETTNSEVSCNVNPKEKAFITVLEHYSFTGEVVRYSNSTDKRQNLVLHQNRPYDTDGYYACYVFKHPYKEHSTPIRTESVEIKLTNKPICINKRKILYHHEMTNAEMTAYIYGSNLSDYNFTWKRNDETVLKPGWKYETRIEDSNYTVKIFNKDILIKTTSIVLSINGLSASDVNAEYQVYATNRHGNDSCSITLEGTGFVGKDSASKGWTFLGKYVVGCFCCTCLFLVLTLMFDRLRRDG